MHREQSVKREKPNKMQQSDVYYRLLSQHVSGIIMPIFRRRKTVCYCMWCTALVLLDVVGSCCGALLCRMWAVHCWILLGFCLFTTRKMFAMFAQELATGQYPEPGESSPHSTSLNALTCYWYIYHENTKFWVYHFFRENQRIPNTTALSALHWKIWNAYINLKCIHKFEMHT